MKNFIFLFIIALLTLSSCKNSEFLNRRYTHFGHSKQKHDRTTAIAKQQHEKAKDIAPSTDTHSADEKAQNSFQDIMPADQGAGEGIAVNESQPEQQTLRTKTENSSIALNSFSTVKQKNLINSVRLTSERALKSTYQKATSAHRGLIFGLINLALFIVICVVIVAGVVFLLTAIA